MKRYGISFGLILLILFSASTVLAQYFGRNKVQYEQFDFKEMDTEHFSIYFYPSQKTAADDAARMLERWRERFAKVLNHDLRKPQPIILYANHADFQQTNVISGIISQGTGGVTEGLKNRIVLPLTGIYKNNDHVLGHELVHAFQFDILTAQAGSGNPFSGPQVPLWFIEGMAEYLSIGQKDPLTDMWIRDAVLNEDIPSIRDVSRNPKYFPYRWGHAIWAYIANKWGDPMVGSLFRSVISRGWNQGFEAVLGITPDSLSEEWNAHLRKTYEPQIAARTRPREVGKPLFKDDVGLNLAPSISPDGQYVAFISQRDVFTLDLYLADARTGEVIKKLVSSNTDAHFDALRFMNSSGAWSPNARKFAFVVFKGGKTHIAILDVASGRIERRISMAGVEDISDLAWSPDGKFIALSGTSGGGGDLYLYDLETDSAQQLTNDRYAEFQPSWSPDGSRIAFATDRGEATHFEKLTFGPIKIGIMDLESGEIDLISIPGATKHINPYFSQDGTALLFVADPEGFSDIYRYSFANRTFEPITRIATGVSGLTALSPAMSMAQNSGDLVFTVFDDTKYFLHTLSADSVATLLAANRAEELQEETAIPTDTTLTDEFLSEPEMGLPPDTSYSYRDYKPSLQLIAIGQPTIGVAVDRFGTSLGGAVSFLFSDMLGDHMLGVAAQANGGIKDLGGQALYLNRKRRFNWGGVIGHIPYRSAQFRTGVETVVIDGAAYRALVQELILQRVFVDRLSFISEYPLSTNRRFEFSAGYTRLSYDLEMERIVTVGNVIVDEERRDLPSPDALNLFQSSIAYVGDYSFFGFTSPASGRRFRVEVEPTVGSLQFLTALADYRHYFFRNPLTLAFRAYHIGRYLKDSESSRLTPLFIGYETMVRGYDIGSFDLSECSDAGEPGGCPEIDRLIGSRIGVFNAEVRLPLFGNDQYGIINFPYIPLELAGFFDAGVAWTKDQSPKLRFETDSAERVPVFSTGIAARINLMGYLVMQFYYAKPFQRPNKSWQFGFVIAPGW